MSTAVVVPPPNSSSLVRRLPRLTARARELLTAINLHLAGVAALLVLALYLLAHLLLVTQALHARGPEALNDQGRLLSVAELQALPLQGLEGKVTGSIAAADAFYAKRLPFAYSQVLTELGLLTRRQSVRLARVQYSQLPVLSGADALIEVHMDASVSGDYRPVMLFLNSLERDRMFFVLNGINLTGQQTGQVNLRVRLTTYLRQPQASESAAEMPAGARTPESPDLSSSPATGGQR